MFLVEAYTLENKKLQMDTLLFTKTITKQFVRENVQSVF